jgi:hypothetical protein
MRTLTDPADRSTARATPGAPGPGVQDAVASGYSTALSMSSTTFFASPNTIIVLSM